MDSTKHPPDVGDDETLALRVVPHFPEDSRLTFADNISVQHTPSEFTITFAQIRQPLVTQSADYEGMADIRADVVARIVLTPSRMADLIKVLRENWALYQRRMKALLEQQDAERASRAESPASKD
jgi:hypothetical protein